jgi:hypothetical protein
LSFEPEDVERTGEGRELTDITRGDHEQRTPRRSRQLTDTAEEALLDGRSCAEGLVERPPSGEL